MLKISDILKKAKEKQKKRSEKKDLQDADDFLLKKRKLKTTSPVEARITDEQKAQALQPKTNPTTGDKDNKVDGEYVQAVELVKELTAVNISDEGNLIKEAEKTIEKFNRIFCEDETLLLHHVFADYSTKEGHFYQHSVNVCLLALFLGMRMNYQYAQLRIIGIAALLHDIGLLKYESIVNQPRKLSESEYAEIKKHPITSKEFLKRFAQFLDLEIFDIILQEHERIDGSGYPFGLKKQDISEPAQLIGVCDTYEAIIHARPHRSRLSSIDVIRELLKNKHSFEHKFLKVLIDNIGIFTVDTMVKLNTRELGIVIKQNQKKPLRPIIDITHNAQHEKLNECRRVDLSNNFSLYIQDSYIELRLKD
ncbi:MAG: HD domain-containing protein [Candidatus Omnitrophica bacterium]|nr:HD domain-containing protein [Candidatus Omnitrophota bacterium]